MSNNPDNSADEIRRKLIAKRAQVGATTPIGRRLSMLVEQRNNGVSPVQTIREIEQIQRDGGRYVHANHFPSHGAM